MIDTVQQSRMSAWLCTRLELELPPPLTCIGSVVGGRIQGVVGFSDYNGASMQMHVAGEGNWATKDLLRLAFRYPFEQCRVKVLLAYVAATNIKSVAMCHHVGFTIEHAITDAHPDGDLLIFAMRPAKCRYLNRGTRHGQQNQVPDTGQHDRTLATATGRERRRREQDQRGEPAQSDRTRRADAHV